MNTVVTRWSWFLRKGGRAHLSLVLGGGCLYLLSLISSVEGFSLAFWELRRKGRNVKKVLEAGSACGLWLLAIREVNFTEPASSFCVR